MFINIENLRIYYETRGEGSNNILLIHGWGIDSSSLSLLAEKLSSDFKIFSLDLPGFGMSEGLEEFDSYKLADVIESFILKLNLKFYSIIGHSLGAKISSVLASRGYGEKLVLVGSPGMRYKKNFALKLKGFIAKIVKFILIEVLFIKKDSKIFKRLRSKIGSQDYKNAPDKMKQSFKDIISEDLSETFFNIKIETLIVHGNDDKQVPLEVAYKIKKLIKNSKLLIIEKTHHFCYNHPIFLEELKKFLQNQN